MKTKAHTNKLQKSSGVFLPLGLVLTLLTVYGLLETKTPTNSSILNSTIATRDDPYDFVQQREILIERLKVEERQEIKKKVSPVIKEDFVTSENSETIESVIIISPEDRPNPNDNIPTFFDEDNGEDLDNDSHLIMDLVQEVPIYPGCEKGSRKQKKLCFENKIRKFVRRKFNSRLGSTLGLSPGSQKILVKFIIDKNGEIKIEDSRASHVRLQKEGERVVKLLPKMVPGKQNGKEVNVSYMLPISFNVE